MIRALYTGASGMIGQQFLVDNVANNLANVNTTGFKRSTVDFQDLLYSTLIQPGTELIQNNQVPTGLQIGNGVRVADTNRIFTAGTLENTGNALDVAIQGNGFIQVEVPDGTLRYTRDGSLKLDSEGNIVTGDGFKVQPNLNIPSNTLSIAISPSGEVTVLTSDSPVTPVQVGILELARFPNQGGLVAEGHNLFRETEASGTPITAQPGIDGLGLIQQFFLEKSNVEVVQELVNLILAQHGFEFNSRSVQVSSQMLQTANDLVR